jgi:RNA polymerase sigma-70 factor (ECF subfamily)
MSFPVTNWDILQRLRSADARQRSGMLGEIVQMYGPSLFAFALHESRGSLTRQDCEDLVGDFFLKCVEGDVIERADQAKGRFRNFLARSFKNFMLNWIRDRSTSARVPPGGVVSLHELVNRHARAMEPRAGETADDMLDRVFRLSVFDRALAAFERSCRSCGQEARYQMFLRREILPQREGVPVPTYDVLAAEFGLPSEDAVGRAVRGARDEFRTLLLALIAQDSVAAEDLQAELKLVLATGLQPWRTGLQVNEARPGWFARFTRRA